MLCLVVLDEACRFWPVVWMGHASCRMHRAKRDNGARDRRAQPSPALPRVHIIRVVPSDFRSGHSLHAIHDPRSQRQIPRALTVPRPTTWRMCDGRNLGSRTKQGGPTPPIICHISVSWCLAMTNDMTALGRRKVQ